MNRELLHQALDALEQYTSPATDLMGRPCRKPIDESLCIALREALAAPQPEPVACKGIPRKGCNYLTPADTVCNKCGEIHHHHQMLAHFYAESAAPAAPQPEPVAWRWRERPHESRAWGDWHCMVNSKPQGPASATFEMEPLYAAPPAAPAPAVPAVAVPSPLTAQEIKDIARSTGHVTHGQAWEIADLLVGGVVSAAPAVPDWDKTLRGAARRSATVVHPGKLAAPVVREPLRDEQIRDLWSWSATLDAEPTASTQQHAFARAIEQAHGIGGGGK
jgi:hypothetical protein